MRADKALGIRTGGIRTGGIRPVPSPSCARRCAERRRRLQAAAGTAVEGRPVDGYACLGDHGIARLPHLGPAFGTKFLYFCSATSSQPALILDRLVARWLRENAGLPLNELRWSVSTYVRYLEIMFGWADELALAADELELCIFSTQAGGIGDSQWAPG